MRPNPLAAEMARRARAWLGSFGFTDEDTFRDLAIGECANWPFPFSDEERAETITKSIALAFCGGVNGARRDWRDVDEACARVMSQDWMRRHAARRTAWMNCLGRDCDAAKKTPTDHLRHRRECAGMIPNLDFIEYQLGWEVPEEVLADDEMMAVETTAGECVAIAGDLFGFTRDREMGRANLVTCAMQEFGENEGDAFKWVGHMHSRTVQELRQLGDSLIRRYAQHPMLAAWFDALHCAIYGFAQWHSRAPRFQATHEADGWTLQVIVTPACHDPF